MWHLLGLGPRTTAGAPQRTAALLRITAVGSVARIFFELLYRFLFLFFEGSRVDFFLLFLFPPCIYIYLDFEPACSQETHEPREPYNPPYEVGAPLPLWACVKNKRTNGAGVMSA